MNREALPFILILSIPIVLLTILLLYLYGHNITMNLLATLQQIPLIYYIIIFPFIFGLFAALLYLKKSSQ